MAYEVVGWGSMQGDEVCDFCHKGETCCYLSNGGDMIPACKACRDRLAKKDRVGEIFDKIFPKV
jgi:hypothetical protein